MEYRGHHDELCRLIHFVNNPVRKTLWITPSNIFTRMTPTVKQWIFCQRLKNGDHFFDKFLPQLLLSGTVPCGSIEYIIPGLWPHHPLPVHFIIRARRWAVITSSGMEDEGSALCAFNRASTTASSSAERGESSSSKARRMSICRCAVVNTDSSSSTSVKLMDLSYTFLAVVQFQR